MLIIGTFQGTFNGYRAKLPLLLDPFLIIKPQPIPNHSLFSLHPQPFRFPKPILTLHVFSFAFSISKCCE